MPLFKVIRASAGSGKTFNLTREYIRLLFAGPDSFMHILAVTFTNKATEEMKSRIIKELYLLASDQPSKQLNGIRADTGLTEAQIRSKASVILKKLLHKYSSFSVNTIDAFFQRIIRSFTRELGIQEGYAIELDTELVLTQVINRLMIKAENDKALLTWLTQFAESLIEKGESWNLRKGIRSLGMEIFKEEFKCLSDTAVKLYSDRNFLNLYRSDLHAIMRKVENTYKSFGERAIAIINSHNLAVDDFSMKSRGPAGFLVKIANSAFTGPSSTAILSATTPEKWYTNASPRKSKIKEIAILELMPLMQEVVAYYNENSRSYFTAYVILKNLYTLGIISDLSQLADAWCSENNTFLLPEAPVFLNKIIDGNDTPFIYEKAGAWYHHFMIDEFQDTSLMQWLNFKPLISNSLSMNFDNLAVGDTKQSIYRWRNSNWEILESRINSDFLPGIIESVTLKENWRSKLNIISFNNMFFKSAASILQDEFEESLNTHECRDSINGIRPITELYDKLEQIQGMAGESEGYVRVQYIDCREDDEYYEAVNNKVVTQLYELIDKGYHLNDIAILTRKNSEAAMLAEFLLRHRSDGKCRLDVISDEALRLGSSIVVNFAVALLQYMIRSTEATNNYFLLAAYANYIHSADQKPEWINPGAHETYGYKDIAKSLPEEFRILNQTQRSYSLIEIAERIVKIFKLEKHKGEQVYLMAFRDLIIEYTRNYGSDVSRFLEYWNESGKEKSVSAPAGQDAVRILTMHKAKGLEFRITIIPYCTWELNSFNRSFLWCKPQEAPFDKLEMLPLTYTTQLQKTVFAGDFYAESHRQYVDNLNLLYVAFTRAQDALFVFARAGDDSKLKNVSDLTRKVVGNQEYIKGNLPDRVHSGERYRGEQIEYKDIAVGTISKRVKVAFQGNLFIDPTVNMPSRPVNDGKILHEIFTLIRQRGDIVTAVDRLHGQGKIASEEKDKYVRFIMNAMNDLQVSTWFTPDWNILNEAEIILPKGLIKRPDRVMTKENQTLIIDYKFGSKLNAAYESQIAEYATLLKEMGYRNIEAYIWYVKLGRVVAVKTGER